MDACTTVMDAPQGTEKKSRNLKKVLDKLPKV
jgi:hypothetical protein